MGFALAMLTWMLAQGMRFLLELSKRDMSTSSGLLYKFDSILGRLLH